MATIILAPEVVGDFDRILDHLVEHESETGAEHVRAILAAVDILGSSPEIGRPARGGKRELVIGRGPWGYVALYRYLAASNTVVVLALRGQREAGYGRSGAQ